MKRTRRRDPAFDGRDRVPVEIPMPRALQGILEPRCRAFRMIGGCTILLGEIPGQGWHMSISHPSRYPTWDEVADARYALIPDNVTMVMILPPKAQYVNLDENCFHLHQYQAETAKGE